MRNTFYGDETRWFIGRVVDNNDPLHLGRVKVRIHGVHSDDTQLIPEYALPWAQVVLPVTEEGATGFGNNPALLPTAQVFGIFLDGKDSQLPLVVGSIPKIETDIPIQKFKDRMNEYENLKGYHDNSSNNSDEDLAGNTNIEKAFNYLISDDIYSYTPKQACGIIGNLLQESNLNPMQPSEVPGEDSYGIAQWNAAEIAGYRQQGLIQYCTLHGYDYTSLSGQLKYLKYELEEHSYLRVSEKLGDLKNAHTVSIASKIFEYQFERPQPGSTQARIDKANKVFERLA